MQKCYYHGKLEAVSLCTGCKLPVCKDCQSGEKGLCLQCVNKRTPIGEKRAPTGSLRTPSGPLRSEGVERRSGTGGLNAPEPPASGRPGTGGLSGEPRRPGTGELRSPTDRPAAPRRPGTGDLAAPERPRCTVHGDTLAMGPCNGCRRPYCPACLNSAGNCSSCAAAAGAATERSPQGDEARRLAPEPAPAPPVDPRRRVLIASVAVVMLVGVFWGLSFLRKPPVRTVDETTATLQKLKENELTDREEKLLKTLLNPGSRPVRETREHAAAVVPAPEAPHVAQEAPPAAVAAAPAAPGRPVVEWVSPAAGSRVSGVAVVKANVVGEVARVDLLVDGEWQGSVDRAPYQIEWASQAVANGAHRLALEIVDGAGAKTQRSVTVTVEN